MENDKKKIVWWDGVMRLSQAFSSGVEFAYADAKGKQVCPMVFCKDYLQDAVYGQINKKDCCVYGFSYKYSSDLQPTTDKIRLLMTNSSATDFASDMANTEDFIHQIEDHLGMTKTSFSLCEDPPKKYLRCGVYYVEGSNRWLNSPVMISLYTLLLRLGCNHKIGVDCIKTLESIVKGETAAYQYQDKSYLDSSFEMIKRILSAGDETVFGTNLAENYGAAIETAEKKGSRKVKAK